MKKKEQDTYYVQTQARRILKCLYGKDYSKLNVNSRYLNGISKTQFWEAFGDLHSIYENYYSQAVEDPSKLPLPLYEIDKYKNMSNEARDSNMSLLDFPKTLIAVGKTSKLNKNILTVKIADFKQDYTKMGGKKLSEQINLLSDNGFVFSGWNGKSFSKKCETFELEYPDNKNILIVLLAIGERFKKYLKTDVDNSNSLSKFERFVFLDPSLYINDSDELPSKTLENMVEAVGNEHKDLIFKIVEKFKDRGMELRFGTTFLKNSFFDKKGKDTLNHITYGDYKEGRDGNECIFLRLKLNNPTQYIEKVNALPKYLKESFENVWCGNCAEKCNKRIVYTLNGKEKRACGCHYFMFKNPNVKDLNILMELYDLEQEVRNKK